MGCFAESLQNRSQRLTSRDAEGIRYPLQAVHIHIFQVTVALSLPILLQCLGIYILLCVTAVVPANTAHKQGKEIIHALGETACLPFAAVISNGAIFQQVVFSAGAISGKGHAGQGKGASAFCVIPRG